MGVFYVDASEDFTLLSEQNIGVARMCRCTLPGREHKIVEGLIYGGKL